MVPVSVFRNVVEFFPYFRLTVGFGTASGYTKMFHGSLLKNVGLEGERFFPSNPESVQMKHF